MTNDVITAEQRIVYMKADVLSELHYLALELDQQLARIERDAAKARAALRTGRQLDGPYYGPIGNQAPFDLTLLTTKANTKIQIAQRLGCTATEINAAYAINDR